MGFKIAPLAADINSHPIAIQGENGNWAVGAMSYFAEYVYDKAEFAPVTNEMRANEYTAKRTWVVSKNDKKFYVDPKGYLIEFVGNSKNVQFIVKDFNSGRHSLMHLFTKDGKYGILSKEMVKGETKTYTTSPVQTLKSEAFDVKTGTWKKTYSNVSQQVTKTTSDKIIQNVHRDACTVCHGKGKTNYTIKWDGKVYVMTKQQ